MDETFVLRRPLDAYARVIVFSCLQLRFRVTFQRMSVFVFLAILACYRCLESHLAHFSIACDVYLLRG